jgi:hypothetical protein
MALEHETVQRPGSGEDALVRCGPRGRQHHGVDDRWNRSDARVAGGDDKGALRSSARLVAQARIIARHQHAHNQYRGEVEDGDVRKYPLAGLGDVLARVLRLGRRHGQRFHAGERVDRIGHDSPEAEKATPGTIRDVCDERPGRLPLMESESWLTGHAAEINHQAQNHHSDD